MKRNSPRPPGTDAVQKKLEASETKAAQLAEDVENAKKAVSDAANA
ncbi:MAG: hypothetical protein V8Q84_12525 [Bilophila sp.]